MENAMLSGKTIVITGSSSGAGRAMALALAPYKPCLLLASRNKKALTETADECIALGAKARVVVTDVTDTAAMAKLAQAAIDWQDKLDVWVNNAGVLAAGPFEETPMAVHKQVLMTNLLGYMNGAHAAVAIFKKQEYGTLINNISIGGYLPVPYGGAYTASKFGLRGFFEALKGELAPWRNIHVCDLFPAFLDTPGLQHAANYTGKVLKPIPPIYDPMLVARAVVENVFLPRSTTCIGGTSVPLKIAHEVFPEWLTKGTGKIMRHYFDHADGIQKNEGNVFETVEYGMSTNGSTKHPATARKKMLVTGVLAGLAFGLYLFRQGSKA